MKWLLFALLACSACGGPPAVTFGDPRREIRADEYDAIFERWTREDVLVNYLDGIDHRLSVSSTFLSHEFRRAYVARYANEATLNTVERQRATAASLAVADAEHEFFVSLVTAQPRWADLDRPTSAWRVRLIDDRGEQFAPTRMERIRTLTPLERAYFPYWTPWRTTYRLFFPVRSPDGQPTIGPGSRFVTLRFSGTLGTVDLRWNKRSPR